MKITFQTSRVEIPEIWDLVGRTTPPSCVSSATRPLSRALLKYCFMFFDMGLEGTGGPGWLSRVFRGPSWGLVIKKTNRWETKRKRSNETTNTYKDLVSIQMDFCIQIIFLCFCAGTTSHRTAIGGADSKGVRVSHIAPPGPARHQNKSLKTKPYCLQVPN